jgi:glycosyltransferase involved in cell wall biosynthesis
VPDYINPNGHTVYLTGADGLSVSIAPYARITLPDFFERYCIKGFIRRVASQSYQHVASHPHGPRPQTVQIIGGQPLPQLPNPVAPTVRNSRAQPLPQTAVQPPRVPPTVRLSNTRQVVGRQLREDGTKLLREAVIGACYPISNNIGVGILSYNRPASLRRLIDSIRCHTDLRRTTVFISDDGSTDQTLLDYLATLERSHNFVVLRGSRLGVAGNSNRLLRCLSRFRHGLLLNDDVEVMARGWDSFYALAADRTGLHHFCMRQPGVYGARHGTQVQRNDVALTVVGDKPHGAVLYFDQAVLEKTGYFDEEMFGLYGMEHVDWSERAQQVNNAAGFFDVAGSDTYFTIYGDASAVPDRQEALARGKAAYAARSPGRGHVAPGPRSVVPRVSCIIPCRNQSRATSIETAIACIRAQRYPEIEIIVAEHDVTSRLQDAARPFVHVLALTAGAGPFNKARVFNAGVAKATSADLILHDADMLVQGDYVAAVAAILKHHDACHLGKTVLYLTQSATEQVEQSGALDIGATCDRVVGYFEGGSLGCKRQTYWRAGGFNQDFVGYGVEDCEFYARLEAGALAWYEKRERQFVHLWHGRADNWEIHHQRNKELGRQLDAMPMAQRLAEQRDRLRRDGYGGQIDAAMS